MRRGHNTDIRVQGEGYHVQTEDWGSENPYIVTRVYKNGAVIRSIKRCYKKALALSPSSLHEAIDIALTEQHKKILDLLQSGQLR